MLKFALIGLGVMGKNHYRALQNIAGVQIAALCDPFCKENFEQKIYTELDEMLESENLDAAIIATPTSLHKEAYAKRAKFAHRKACLRKCLGCSNFT